MIRSAPFRLIVGLRGGREAPRLGHRTALSAKVAVPAGGAVQPAIVKVACGSAFLTFGCDPSKVTPQRVQSFKGPLFVGAH